MARLDVEAATYPAAIDAAVARALWDTDNQKCFDHTMLAMFNCPEGQTVLSVKENRGGGQERTSTNINLV